MPEDKVKLVKLMPDRSPALFNGTDCDRNHIRALIGAAKEGDSVSLKELDCMFRSVHLIVPPPTPTSSATTPSSSIASLPSSPTSPQSSFPVTSRLLQLQPNSPSYSLVLDACDQDIEAPKGYSRSSSKCRVDLCNVCVGSMARHQGEVYILSGVELGSRF
jgi:hypothetical protein